jgi:hypothetical protein
VFNDSVDAYQTWTLFLIFISIVILISGVVLLTLKKPENRGGAPTAPGVPGSARSVRPGRRRSDSKQDLERGEGRTVEQEGRELDDDQTLWGLGEMSDDEDGDDGRSAGGRSEGQRTPRRQLSPDISRKPEPQRHPGEEGRGLMGDEEEDEDEEHLSGRPGRRSTSPVPSVSSNTAVWR